MPNRGEILDFNRQVPLSRPLFDGFGSINVDSTTKPTIENKKAIAVGSASDSSTQSNVVMERLPNGWSKKAVKRLSGTSKGNKNIVIHKYNVGCCILAQSSGVISGIKSRVRVESRVHFSGFCSIMEKVTKWVVLKGCEKAARNK